MSDNSKICVILAFMYVHCLCVQNDFRHYSWHFEHDVVRVWVLFKSYSECWYFCFSAWLDLLILGQKFHLGFCKLWFKCLIIKEHTFRTFTVSKPLWYYSDLSCMCTTHWQIWDLGGGLSLSSFLEVFDMLFRIRYTDSKFGIV